MPARRDGTEPMIAHGGVYLRPPEREDVPILVRWFGDARTSRNLSRVAPMSIAMEEGWFEHTVESQGRDGYHFIVCLLSDDRPIGTCGLFELDLRNGSAGLGISIGDPADTGHGYGSDAMRALIGWSFDMLRLERIWLDVYSFNTDARRLYERLGFVHEGVSRHGAFRFGEYVDLHRMSILSGEWRGRRAATD